MEPLGVRAELQHVTEDDDAAALRPFGAPATTEMAARTETGLAL